MLTVTDAKTGSVLTFVANRTTSNISGLNNVLTGRYHVLQNGNRTPMSDMSKADAEKAIAKMAAAGMIVAGALEVEAE